MGKVLLGQNLCLANKLRDLKLMRLNKVRKEKREKKERAIVITKKRSKEHTSKGAKVRTIN